MQSSRGTPGELRRARPEEFLILNNKSEIRKHNSNDAKCGELGWVCIPLVVETVHMEFCICVLFMYQCIEYIVSQ